MQSFAEFMADSFRSNVPLAWDLSGVSHVTASFFIDSIQVIVTFERREASGPWYVLFEVQKAESTEVAHSAFAIFNGVFQAAEEFIDVRRPDTLVFATKRDELAGVYQTYLRRESTTIERLGYRLEGPVRVEPYSEFLLRRMTAPQWKS